MDDRRSKARHDFRRTKPTARPSGPSYERAGRGRVLVVDDEEMVGRATLRVLEGAGFQGDFAIDGSAAIASLIGAHYDCVVSDVRMPNMSGLELLTLVRRYDIDVPVILMTAAPDVRDAARAVELGALRYLTKPVAHDELLAAVDRAVALGHVASAKREASAATGSSNAPGDRVSLGVALDSALEHLFVVFQPIVDFSARATFGYEALMRSNDANLKTPAAILDAAERLGRTADVGRRVREVAARDFSRAPEDALLFINLHPLDLLDQALFDEADPLGPIAERTILEITERSRLGDLESVKARVEALRKLGFRVAIDDIGAGYSGLSSFALLEPELIKIDMSLIRGIEASPIKSKVVKNLGALCWDLGLGVIAEGVETVPERECLAGLGFDLFQGYLFAKPGPPFPGVDW